jgi:hypothetical protein
MGVALWYKMEMVRTFVSYSWEWRPAYIPIRFDVYE